jgi:hypothetical protein
MFLRFESVRILCCMQRWNTTAWMENGSFEENFFHSPRDENGLDMNGYYWYYICFYIFVWIRIQIQIGLIMSDRIRLDIDIINMWFEYFDTDIDGYNWYYICFLYFCSDMDSNTDNVNHAGYDTIWLDINIINIWFEYLDMDTVSDISGLGYG